MIRSAKLSKEIVVLSKNQVGMLRSIAGAFADRGINITAISAQIAGGVGLMNFVVDEHLRACDLLRKKKYSIYENSIVVLEVEDKPGVLKQITSKLAAKKIDILNVYGSAPSSYGPCTLVASTSNNQKALLALK